MKETRELTCINCPLGCRLTVESMGEDINVMGNGCPRGEKYAKKEISAPSRTVTSTVSVIGGEEKMVAVRTKTDIPKKLIFDCMEEINNALVRAPIRIGQVIIEDVAGCGVSVVATANVEKKKR